MRSEDELHPVAALDAVFLGAETPAMPMHMLAIAVMEPGSDGLTVDDVRQVVVDRLAAMPQLCRRAVPTPFGVDHAVWVEEAELDLEHHVQVAALPRPGGPAELAAFLGDLAERRFDPARPLWGLTVLEGMESGHVALVAKVHHALFDGVTGLASLAQLFDLEPVVPETDSSPDAAARSAPQLLDPHPPDAQPSGIASSASTALRASLPGVVDLLALSARRWLGRPLAVADAVAGTYLAVRASVHEQQASPPLPGGHLVSRAPWNGAIGAQRSMAMVDLPLEDLRSVARTFGVTVNDVLLAGVGGALRRRLVRAGMEPSPGDRSLLAMVPVSVRLGARPAVHETSAQTSGGTSPAASGAAAGNELSAMVVSLATDVADPLTRLRAVADASTAAKARLASIPDGLVTAWAELAVPAITTRLARLASNLRLFDRVPPPANVVVSDVVGPEVPLWCAGHRVVALYPFGPVADGIGLNITAASYGPWLGVGLSSCRRLLPDLSELAADLRDCCAELTKHAASLRCNGT